MEGAEEGGLNTVDHCGKVYSAYEDCLTHQMRGGRQSYAIDFFLALSLAMASKNTLSREQVASAQVSGDYAIKSEDKQPVLDTSQWPLLLKNYDKLLVRSSHFTPIPSGCSPLKRDIETYVK
jgi:hypothetical protein